MEARRRLLMQGADGLPREFQRVEYLEGSGTQYIETGIKPSNTLGFDCTFMPFGWMISIDGQYGCIFGGRVRSGDRDFQLTTYSMPGKNHNGGFRNGKGGDSTYDAGMLARGQKQTAHYRSLIYTAPNGTIANITAYDRWNDISFPIYLFALNQNQSAIQSGPGCRIYSITFYNERNVIANFIPCIRKSDSKPGMYDTVTKTFYTNAGTGEFIVPA